MSSPVEQRTTTIALAAEALLREHPDAQVCGLASDGLIVPVPQSVGLWGQAAIEARAVIDLVVANDRMTVIDAWLRVKQDGIAEGKVRLLSKPSCWMTLHFLDLRAVHDVLLCILLPSDEAPEEERDAHSDELEAATPRFATLKEDEGGTVLDCDEAFTEMVGFSAEEVIGKQVLDHIHPEDQARAVEGWIAMLSSRRVQQIRIRRKRKDGSWMWVDLTLHNYLNEPERKYVLVELIDVSAEMAAQESLQEQGELLRRLIEAMPDGLLQLDTERNVVYHNPRLLQILHSASGAGSVPSDVKKRRAPTHSIGTLLDSVTDEGTGAFEAALGRVLEEGIDQDVEVDVALTAGDWRRVLMSIRVLRRANGDVSGAITSVLDVTDSARARQELEKRATFDALTRCHNRASILAALELELEHDDATSTGVIYVDLDNFKSVNDTLGHAAGDESLAFVAERLRAASRDEDKIGRLGGDEFLVLVPGIPGLEVAMSVAERFSDSLRTSVKLSCGTIELRASIGVACTEDEAIGAAELVERADAAMYRSKAQGGGLAVLASEPQDMRGDGDHEVGLEPPARTIRRGRGEVETHAMSGEVTTRQEIDQRLARHAREHDAVARLGQIALREHDLRTLLDEVVATVADTLDVQRCGVLKLRNDEEVLDVISGLGHNDGPSALPAGAEAQAGYALSTRKPVVAEDLHTETRFDTQLLLEQGMVSGMNAVIEGHERAFGVLSVHTTQHRHFSADDVNFLVAVANVLSAAVERHGKQEVARHAALHDPLTGLPNRTLALDRLDLALARRRRDGTDVAMLLLDLDRFKIINDSLGHVAGDQVLIAVASRLCETLRPSDTIARLSGDEFAVVCERPDGVRHVVELAERIGEAVSQPLVLASGEHFLTASIGIAVPDSAEDTSSSLLRDADAAMYRAKKRGPGRYELFDATVRAQVVARLRTETELRQALDHEQLRIHYQPIIDLASGHPVAMEALVRWEHPRHGLIPPLDFIPIAEETGLIIELGRHVLEQACTQGAAWQRRFDLPLQMFVNVSGCQLVSPTFPAEVSEVARRSGLLTGTLGLEVTESVLIEEGSSMSVLTELHEHGLRLALDDFGTGYSSLSYLRRFPLDDVKVDRSFIDGLGIKPQDAAIMRAIVEMCRALGLTVVAEGVDCDAQLRQLRQLGCEHVQGYLMCHPMPAEEISEFLDERLLSQAPSVGTHMRASSVAGG